MQKRYLNEGAVEGIVTGRLVLPVVRLGELLMDRVVEISHTRLRPFKLFVWQEVRLARNQPLTSNMIQDRPICMHVSIKEPLPPHIDRTQ
jgi:hypothetical protein